MKLKQRRPSGHAGSSWLSSPTMRMCGVGLVGCVLFLAGAVASRAGWLGAAKELLFSTWSEMVASVSQSPDVAAPRLILDIKQKHIESIIAKRNEALDRGILLASSDDYVPARISTADKAVRVSLRLKGDWTDHLVGEKWSFRIKVKGDRTLFGMKQFSVQHPVTRNYVYEWLFHQALRRADIIALRYRFVRLTLNGKDLGLYALEEHFDKRLIENNRRREGPILRFNEDLYWSERVHGVAGQRSHYFRSKVDAFKLRKTLASETQRPLFEKAAALLTGFRNGVLSAEDVFEIRRMGMLYALVDLLGARHATLWHNIRFYYNPITSRLEPIGFDANAGKSLDNEGAMPPFAGARIVGRHSSSVPFQNQLASDPAFFRAYHRALVQVCADGYLEDLLAAIRPELSQNLALLRTEFDVPFSSDVFHDNRKTIRALLRPVETVRAHLLDRVKGRARLAITSLSPFPCEITSAGPAGAPSALPKVVTIPAMIPGRPVPRTEIEIPEPEGAPDTWVVGARLAGTEKVQWLSVLPRAGTESVGADPTLPHRSANCTSFPFVSVDETNRKIYIATGTWEIKNPILFPAGYTVVSRTGTRLVLHPGAHLLSYSPLDWTGEREAPVVVTSSGFSPAGLAVLGAKKNSVLRHVEFIGLGAPVDGDWSLSAGVTFYESPVSMQSCRVRDAAAEDAINVVRCEFALTDVLFERCRSDALDADFAHGVIEDSTFVRIGNDAVDLSGSNVTMRRVRISGVGDKGISAGERSHIDASSLDLSDVEIGFAAKDRSDIHVTGAKLRRCRLAFAVYQKKPEYGPGSIHAQRITLQDVTRAYLVERGSYLRMNAESITGSLENIEALLYGNEFGKSSR